MADALNDIKDPSLLERYGRVASYRERCFTRPARSESTHPRQLRRRKMFAKNKICLR